MSSPTPFLITIDTEGDHLWSRPDTITTDNAAYLDRFQQLCERYRLRPTYLTNWEMASCPVFREFARDVLTRKTAEIGMHLHAWNSPPLVPLTENDFRHQPFLIDYPTDVMRSKVAYLTSFLEDSFQQPIVTHRAGRWAFNSAYARILIDQGYRVDCSVTPGISWSHMKGEPSGNGGSDYRGFRHSPYMIDPTDIAQADTSSLLEVPMSIRQQPLSWVAGSVRKGLCSVHRRLGPRIADRFVPSTVWLRPNGRNRTGMGWLLECARTDNWPHVEFMLHSSELMPGGSPRFETPRQIERLYDDLEALFSASTPGFSGMTLNEFSTAFTSPQTLTSVTQQLH